MDIYCANRFIGNEPFAVLLGDIIIKSKVPCLKQLIDVFNQYHKSVIGVQEVKDEDVSKYGVIGLNESISEKVYSISELVEKPSIKEAPSKYAIMGRYILTPDIFEAIEPTLPGSGNEVQLTDAIKQLTKRKEIIASVGEGLIYDIGDKLGFVKATIDFSIERKDLMEEVEIYQQKVIKDSKRKVVNRL